MTGKVLPLTALCHSLLMKICVYLISIFGIVEVNAGIYNVHQDNWRELSQSTPIYIYLSHLASALFWIPHILAFVWTHKDLPKSESYLQIDWSMVWRSYSSTVLKCTKQTAPYLCVINCCLPWSVIFLLPFYPYLPNYLMHTIYFVVLVRQTTWRLLSLLRNE
jgi:hypothetical protein